MWKWLASHRNAFRTVFVVTLIFVLFMGGQSHGFPVPDETIWWAKFSVTGFAVVSLLAFWFDRMTFLAGIFIFAPLAIAARLEDLFRYIERHR